MTVLVLTRDALDSVADLVILELNARGVPVHRLDPAGFPQQLVLEARIGSGLRDWDGKVHGQHRDLSLDDVHAVYYRRPGRPELFPGLSEQHARWAREEAQAGFGGLLATLECTWVNHPHRNTIASVAPLALAAAVRCGLDIPRTLITNDPSQAREFVAGLPGRAAAYKALGVVPPGEIDGHPQALWTTKVHASEITDGVAHTAHQFQEWVDKAYEVRLTVVDGQMFAAQIHTGSPESRIDFRTDYDNLTYTLCTVPDTVADGMRRLMDHFHLRYAAADFLVNHDGRHLLCDLNPNGQFGFIPELQQPIARALADLLEGPRRS